ncbi:hypothetical protein TNCV_2815041 [Trichonephila clavipes]|nr:hypothetical protein TNCV_2815041 [Trichonephila clavipes]
MTRALHFYIMNFSRLRLFWRFYGSSSCLCAAQFVFLNELVPEEAFQLLSKYFVAVLAVTFSALREPKIFDFVQLLLHRPAMNFWMDQISASEAFLKNGVCKNHDRQKGQRITKSAKLLHVRSI